MTTVKYEADAEIAVLTVDNPPVNALSHSVRAGLVEGANRANADPAIKAIVIVCAGKSFIAGADITEFGKPMQEPRMRGIQAAVEAGKPVVAAMHGTALGGGLELTMACHWRIARRDAKIGLPEVNIGVIPGGGGTQRLPRLVGPKVALDLAATGKHYDAAWGQKVGLIDELFDGDPREAGVAFARKVVAEGLKPAVTSRSDEKVRGVDPQIFTDYRKKIEKSARGLLAQWKVVDCIEIACKEPFEVGDKAEFQAFEECVASPQRAGLQHIFKAERAARKIPGLEGVKPLPIRKAAVLGSGTMGGGIAMSFANVGIPVALVDVSEEALKRGMGVIEKNYATSVERGSTPAEKAKAAFALITPSTSYDAVSDVDIVIEAIFEDMDLKKKVFAELDRKAPPQAILASNTSSLNIDTIAEATSRPDKVAGTHFFSPANVMKLLENVRGAKSSPETLATIMNMGLQLDKVPVLAGNCDAFIGNRMYQFYCNAWEYLAEEGATPEQIDKAAVEFGYAMGPVAARDLAGLDVAALVRKARAPTLPKEERLSPMIEKLVALGRVGQKAGAGFHKYEGRTAVPDPEVIKMFEETAKEYGVERRAIPDDEIMPRLLAPLVNQGAKILEEGIALRAGDIDVVYCYGYGFPKHKGGPMFWGKTYGLDKIVEIMRPLEARFGPRYKVSPLLERLAKSGEDWPA